MNAVLERHREQFEADPSRVQAFEALEEHYFLESDWDELVALYDQRLAANDLQDKPAVRARLLFRLGQVLEERCARVADALTRYEEAARLAPDFQPALGRLRVLYGQREQWELALQVAELEARTPMRPVERASFHAEIGEIWLTRMEDPAEALTLFERALADDMRCHTALRGRARALAGLERVEEAASTLERLLTMTPAGEAQGAVLLEMARLHAEASPETALPLLDRALELAPDDAEIVAAASAIAGAAEQWGRVLALAEQRFAQAIGAHDRVEIALETAGLLLEHQGDAAGAHGWLERARELAPDDVRIHLAQADAASLAGNEALQLEALGRASTLAPEQVPVDALVELGEARTARGDPSAAVEPLRRALERAPGRPDILDALVEAHRAMGSHDELVELLETRASTNHGTERAEALAQIAAVHERHADDAAAALDALQRAFEANPATPGVALDLERLYRKQEDWDGLLRVLEQARTAAPDAERPALLCSLGELLTGPVAASERAADRARAAYEEALDLDPACERALRGLAELAAESGDEDVLLAAWERESEGTTSAARRMELLRLLAEHHETRGDRERAEHFAERASAEPCDDPDQLEAFAELLERLARPTARIAVLERLAQHRVGAPRARIERQIADLLSETHQPDAAVDHLQAAVEADPHDVETLRLLGARLRDANRLEELARTWRALAARVAPSERTAVESDLAALLVDELDDPNAAVVVLWRLVDVPDAPEDVNERLEAALESTRRFGELAQRLTERRQAAPDDSVEARDLDLRRAHVLRTQLGQYEQAAPLYRQAYENLAGDDPRALAPLDGLEACARGAGDDETLCWVLHERAGRAANGEEWASVQMERAALLDERQDDLEEARRIYEDLVEAGGEHRPEAERRLTQLLERLAAWEPLRCRLEAQLEQASPSEALALRERLVELCLHRLGDRDAASEHLTAATGLAPQRIDLFERLAALHEEAGRGPDARACLEAALEARPEPAKELALRCAAARLATSLDEPESARIHLERVLEIEPGHADAVAFLAEHYRQTGRTDELVELLTARIATLEAMDPPDRHAAASLRVRAAELRDQILGDAESAIRELLPSSRPDPNAADGLGPAAIAAPPLAEMLARHGHRAELIELAQELSQAARDPAQRADWCLRLGTALHETGELGRAISAFRDALGFRPGDPEAERALRALYREAAEWEPLVRLLEARLVHLAGPEEIALRSELADVLQSQLARQPEALVHLRRVLELEPGNEPARDAALALAESLGDAEAMLELLAEALSCTADRARRAVYLLRQGEMLAGPLGRPAEAVTAFREAVASDPDDRAARSALRAALEQTGDWPSFLDELHLQVRTSEGAARVALLERGAGIAADHLSPDASLPWLEQLRAERSDDPDVLARIADVHRRAGRPEAVLRALEAEANLTDDRERRQHLTLEQAAILERDLDSRARAIATLENARSEDPANAAVLAELDRLYAVCDRPRERALVLERRLEGEARDARGPLHRALAELYTGPLCDPRRAALHLAAALETEGGPRAALLQARGEALRAAGRTDEWAAGAEEELEALDPRDPVFRERRRELHRGLADAYGRWLGDPDTALHHLRALVDGPVPDPDDELACEERAGAESALIEALRRGGAHGELALRLARRMEHAPNPAAWLELARLHEERLHSPTAAAKAYAAAAEAEPANLDALRGLRRTGERRGDFEAVADALERELAAQPEAPAAQRSALLRTLGEVTWRKLGSTTRASRAFAEALEVAPGDLAAVRALEQLFEAMEDWGGATDLYSSEIELLGEDEAERRRELHLRVSALAQRRLEDPERAVASLYAADALAPLESHERRLLAGLLRAQGDLAGCARELERWCEDPEAGAQGNDHLELAQVLESLGQRDEALARVDLGLRGDSHNAELWRVCARLNEALGQEERAAEAWSTCAEHSSDAAASLHLVRAAGLVAAETPERALEWLQVATRRDPGEAEAHAALAHLAERCGELDEAETAAATALDLAAAGSDLTDEQQRDTALVGARCAQSRRELEAAARFATTARAIDPDSLEALGVQAQVFFAMGEIEGARRALERRLEAAGDAAYPERGEHLVLLAAALEAAGELDAALARYAEALDLDTTCDDARAGVVRVHERAGRLDEALEARLAWAAEAAPKIRARQLVRVAELELARGAGEEVAERHVREALDADPSSPDAHLLLTTRLAESGRLEEALELSTAGIEHAHDGDVRARLASLRARVLEQRGDREGAAGAWGIAANADPRGTAAVLAQARILRALGEWESAAQALADFADHHPGDDPIELAPVHFQRGRLLAGPLERVDEGLDAYRAAIAANPRYRDAHAAVAGLLVHRPDDWDEALARHRDLLEANPSDTAFLRGVLKIAAGRERSEAAAQGRTLLASLGAASPAEARAAADTLGLRVGGTPELENPVWERARRLAVTAAEEIARALGASAEPADSAGAGNARSAFHAAALAAEGELAAPALVPLDDNALGEVLRIVAALAGEAEQIHGDGHRVNRLSAELGRRARRRIRRELANVEPHELDEIDFTAWRRELRTLAHAEALDQSGGDLRNALLALASNEADLPLEAAGSDCDLAAALEVSPAASALLRRVVLAWIDGI